MKKLAICIVVLAVFCLAGCGNVHLWGEAMTAAETSTMDALQAAQRAGAEPETPAWETAYLQENFKQWRLFVRGARKDETWGPKMEGE